MRKDLRAGQVHERTSKAPELVGELMLRGMRRGQVARASSPPRAIHLGGLPAAVGSDESGPGARKGGHPR